MNIDVFLRLTIFVVNGRYTFEMSNTGKSKKGLCNTAPLDKESVNYK